MRQLRFIPGFAILLLAVLLTVACTADSAPAPTANFDATVEARIQEALQNADATVEARVDATLAVIPTFTPASTTRPATTATLAPVTAILTTQPAATLAPAPAATPTPEPTPTPRPTPTPVLGIDLAVLIEPQSEHAIPGQELPFTFTVTNHGTNPAPGVILRLTLSSQTTLLSVLPQKQCLNTICNFGKLNPGDSVSGLVSVLPNLGPDSEISVRLEISGIENEPRVINNVATITVPYVSSFGRSGSILWLTNVEGLRSSRITIGARGVYLYSWQNGEIYAIDKTNGSVLWRYILDGRLNSSVVISSNSIFFTTSGGYVSAIDSLTGELQWRWRYRTGENLRPEQLISVSTDRVYVASDEYLYALVASEGSLLWKYPLDVALSSDPIPLNDGLYFSTTNSESAGSVVHGIHASSGNLKWRYEEGSILRFGPFHATSESVYLVSNQFVHSIDLATGELNWEYLYNRHTSNNVLPNTWAAKENLYFAHYGSVFSLNSVSGELNWRQQFDLIGDTPWYSFIFGTLNDSLYVGARKAGSVTFSIYSLDRSSGSVNWNYSSPKDKDRSMTAVEVGFSALYSVKGEALYFQMEDRLYVIEASTGQMLWEYEHGVGNPLAVTDDAVYGSGGNRVFALIASQ